MPEIQLIHLYKTKKYDNKYIHLQQDQFHGQRISFVSSLVFLLLVPVQDKSSPIHEITAFNLLVVGEILFLSPLFILAVSAFTNNLIY